MNTNMEEMKATSARGLSVVGFSFFFAFILSFQFEGQVLYSLLLQHGTDASGYILAGIIAHFAGLITCGLFVKSQADAKSITIYGTALCLSAAVPFFFAPSFLWTIGLIVSGYFSGCVVAAWGYYLKAYTPKNERIKSCAEILI